jgi:hypothetical protein
MEVVSEPTPFYQRYLNIPLLHISFHYGSEISVFGFELISIYALT